MKFGLRNTLMLIGVGGFAYGVYSYYTRQIKILQNLSFAVKKVKIIEATLDRTKLQITLQVINRSEINFTIVGYDLAISVNGEPISVVKNTNFKEEVKGFGEKSRITFNANVNPQQIFGDVLGNVLGNVGNTSMRIVGKVNITKYGIPIPDYPVDMTLKLKDFL